MAFYTQPHPNPHAQCMPYPHTSSLQQSGLLLGWGQGASTPFAFNKEPGSSLGRWTALSTWGISVPKNMPGLVKTHRRNASYSTSAGLVSSVLALAKTPFMLDSHSWWELSLTSSKGRNEFLQITSDEQGLAGEAVRRTPR